MLVNRKKSEVIALGDLLIIRQNQNKFLSVVGGHLIFMNILIENTRDLTPSI
jgi:hypothetical protein